MIKRPLLGRQSALSGCQEKTLLSLVFCLLATGYWLLIFLGVTPAGNIFAAEKAEIPLGPLDGKTDENGLPGGWKELTYHKIPRHTQYTLVHQEGLWAIKAESRDAASALYKEIELDPKKYQIIRWRWKIKNILPKGDESKKEGDDYAARVYITFKYIPEQASAAEQILYALGRAIYGKYPPKATLNYIWANKLPPGQAADSPYTDRAKLIAVESGPALAGQWRTEERNIYEDYKKYFGSEPPPINGIALMTDTDNTHGEAEAFYAEMILKEKE